MGLKDLFRGKEYRRQIEKLEKELEITNQTLKESGGLELHEMNQLMETRRTELVKLQKTAEDKEHEIDELNKKIADLNKQIVSIEDIIEMESYGFYQPRYEFATSLEYKEKLDKLRKTQKKLLRINQRFLMRIIGLLMVVEKRGKPWLTEALKH